MADKAIKFRFDPDKTLRLFPDERHDVSLSTWGTNAKVANQRSDPDKGLYDATIDDTYRYWVVFEGADQPIDWSKWVYWIDTESAEISDRDLKQLRFRMGMDGDVQAPVEPVSDPIVITPGSSNLKCVGWLLCLNSSLDPEPNVVVSFRMIRGPGASGFSYNTPVETVTSDSEGIARMESLRRGSTIEYWRSGSSQKSRKTAVIPDAPTFALPELL